MNSDKFLKSVSQSINMTYHSPALLYVSVSCCLTELIIYPRGDELKIVNTTMTMGTKSMVARTEASGSNFS